MIKPRILASCHQCQMYRLSSAMVCRLYPVGFPGESCPDFAALTLNDDSLSWNRVYPPETDCSDDQNSRH